jgi:hypothetical protein
MNRVGYDWWISTVSDSAERRNNVGDVGRRVPQNAVSGLEINTDSLVVLAGRDAATPWRTRR